MVLLSNTIFFSLYPHMQPIIIIDSKEGIVYKNIVIFQRFTFIRISIHKEIIDMNIDIRSLDCLFMYRLW